MIRAVIDTNLLIAYLLTQGATLSQLVDHWESGNFTLVMSVATMAELKEVVRRPRLKRIMRGNANALIDTLEQDALFVAEKLMLSGVCRDPKDDKFIACAVEGEADFLVSGDEDLLVLMEYKGVKMVIARTFVEYLDDLIDSA